PYPLFVKPVAEGTSKGIGAYSVVGSTDQLVPLTARLMGEHKQPLLVEAYLGGRELTVGVVGSGESAEAVGVLEVLFRKGRTNVYSYTHKELWQRYIHYQLAGDLAAQQAQDMALTIWRGFGCRDAGRVDFRLDTKGKVHFLEVNPLPGLHPTHSDLPILWMQTGRPYRELIRSIVESAHTRVAASAPSLSMLESVRRQAGYSTAVGGD
ncbi:MAG: D-alanine--D-alanine ligase, partial [Chitinivibrionales bacterium]|nr:D-alanine--D-alanine ligase [Chitinivibrionales bacterium]